jgi:hypothetical protein
MENYLALITQQLGIPIFMLIAILLWSALWKFLALWKAGRNNAPVWFIVLALFNTMGILEILYIFVFSKMKTKTRRARHKRIR